MFTTVQGVYRDGRVELAEQPRDIHDDTPVIVTFLAPAPIDLRERGIDEAQALDLHDRLAAFAEEWDSSEMDAYDDYDAAKASL